MGLYKVTTRGTTLLTYDVKADSEEEAEAEVGRWGDTTVTYNKGRSEVEDFKWVAKTLTNEVIISVEEYTTELKWEEEE